MPAPSTYQYNTVKIAAGTAEAVISATLAAQGTLGWRLISVAIDPVGDHYAYFEKKATALFDSNGKSNS